MPCDVIWNYFRMNFPRFSRFTNIKSWRPYSDNSIWVKFEGDDEYIFTYNGDDNWCFETVKSFTRRLKGDYKM